MNLMDMLSSDGPDMYQEDDMMGSLLEQQIEPPEQNLQAISQPPNAVYYLPASLTKIQRELMECIINVFAPQLLQDVYVKRQRTKIHSLLDSDDADPAIGKKGLSYDEKISFLFEQLQTVSKHPSLLVDHFLPKKLLLSDVNERVVSMSGKFQLFNCLVDSILDNFHREAKFEESPVYNILVVAESVKELELIEGLIIGKNLHYANVSSRKLYDDNRPLPGTKAKTPSVEPHDTEDSEDKPRKRPKRSHAAREKSKPQLCLYLIRSSQLVNQYIPTLSDGTLQPRLIFSFDNELDLESPNLDMLRTNSNSTHFFDKNPFKTPIVMPVPLFSLEHMMLQISKPSAEFENEHLLKWRESVVNQVIVNRDNLFDDSYSELFGLLYGNKFRKLFQWLVNWDTVAFPTEHQDVLLNANDKIITSFTDDKLEKKLKMKYLGKLLDVDQEVDGVKEEDTSIDTFDYKTYKAKLSQVVHSRLNYIDEQLLHLYETVIPKFRVSETERQARLDQDEDEIARNYKELRQVNDQANILERAFGRVDNELNKYQDEKADLESKLEHLKTLSEDTELDVSAKLKDQQALLDELQKDQTNLIEEYDKILAENDATRVKYQESSGDAVKLTLKVSKTIEQSGKVEAKLSGPGIKILPSLLRKDDLINHETTLKKVANENEFLVRFYEDRLEKLLKERQGLLEHTVTGSTSRPGNRISRGSTPF